MIYYKDNRGDVFAYESKEDFSMFGGNDLVKMSEKEVLAHLNPQSPPLTRSEVNELRRMAYADPITGSDPLYIEYQRSAATGEAEELVAGARSAWLNRADEIALKYPWPAE